MQALADLEAACEFMGRDAPRSAEMFAARVFQATDRLADFPLLGRVVPELANTEVRERIVRGYRIIYRLRGDDVQVLTVRHGARLLADRDLVDSGV